MALSAASTLPTPFAIYNKPSPLRFLLRSPQTLKLPPCSANPDPLHTSPSPIFLPHLQIHHDEEEPWESEQEECGEEEEEEEELELDPIRDFFKSRTPRRDPKHEGRLTLQRNRRTSWHIADSDDSDDEIEDEEPMVRLELESAEPADEEGAVGEILRIARNLPENATLAEILDPYAGKIAEGECIELLGKMGEKGLVSGCLYLYEWMGMQEPSLVTPRACSVLFPILGRGRMGRQLMILFENLPQSRLFRDVHVYNAAISGLSCCNRLRNILL